MKDINSLNNSVDRNGMHDFRATILLQFILDYLGLYSGKIDGLYGVKTRHAWEKYNSGAYDRRAENEILEILKSVPADISHASFCIIAYFEGGGRDYYTKKLARPTVPSSGSGITIGLGYDISQQGVDVNLLSEFLTTSQIERLKNLVQYTGNDAFERIGTVTDIFIDYKDALRMLAKNLVKYIDKTRKTFKNTDKLNRDQFGALVSLVFNRGTSLHGPRRIEMFQIAKSMEKLKFDEVPQYIRAMKRLWWNLPGLLERRELEAKLWEESTKR